MNSFLEPVTLIKIIQNINFTKKLLLSISQGFCLKVSEDLFYRAPPCVLVVNRLCSLFKILQIYVNNKINN